MAPDEKKISFENSNTYSTLNALSPKTKKVWLVFHGIGYLSRYFLKYFDQLDPDENYIIAPQAPSKYYLNGQYTHVGACWLTKENTAEGIANLMRYLDAVLVNEAIPNHCELVVFGYSQGVSIALRAVALKKLKCQHLILYAGGVPNELTPDQFSFLGTNCTIRIIMGDQDEYLTEDRMKEERKKINAIFNGKALITIFHGGHEIKKEIIRKLP
jgi:predicted esterase